jgi:hypothetical protein
MKSLLITGLKEDMIIIQVCNIFHKCDMIITPV